METPEYSFPQRNIFEFDYITEDNRKLNIRFNSHFDSGNMLNVEPQPNNLFLVTTAPDCYGTEYQGHTRSWFYFSVTGVQKGVRLAFRIPYIHMLFSLYKKAPDTYRPVYRVDDGPWSRLPESAILTHNEEQNSLEVQFSYTFEKEEDEVYFAFSYPFSYSQSQRMLENLQAEYKDDPEIYFHRDKIALSPQERIIDLLTISSHEGKMICTESWLSDELFPFREKEPRAAKFRPGKPVILITARVHPGETPGSHAMNGILKFMLDKTDVRAFLLRRYFVLMVVPMINPDGVSLGHYRMDIFHHNLNRHYKEPDPQKQPQIFAIKELVTYLKSEERLFFFCDLHSHAEKKGCFLFGNALDYPMHVESVLFAKVMSLNSINFEFESCDFSKRQMNTRDRGEKLTKEGAARVCVYKIANILHSYTLECGFHYSVELSNIPNLSTNVNIGDFNCNENNVTDINSDMYTNGKPVYYTIEIYEDIGKAMMISILDIFQRNPCSRIANSTYGNLESIRKELAFKVMKYARFKKDVYIRKKYLKIEDLAKEIFYDNFTQKNCFFDDYKKKASSYNSIEGPFTRRYLVDKKALPEKSKTPGMSISIPNMTMTKMDSNKMTKNALESPKYPPRKVFPTKMQTIGTKESLNIDLRSIEQDENRVENFEDQTFSRFGSRFQNPSKVKALAPLPHDYITRQRMINQKLKLTAIYQDPRETPKKKGAGNPFEDFNERDLEEEKSPKEHIFSKTKYQGNNIGTLQPVMPYKKYTYKTRLDKFSANNKAIPGNKLPDIKGVTQGPNGTGSAYFLVVEAKNLVGTAKNGQKKMDFGSRNFELNDSHMKN